MAVRDRLLEVRLGRSRDLESSPQLFGSVGRPDLLGPDLTEPLARAQWAAEQDVDYLAFGRFFPSRTKPDAVQAGLDLIRRAKQQLSLPVAAIGGITTQNASTVLDAGVDMLAVVQGVFAAADVRQAAADYAALFQRRHHEQTP